jgi:hypothetical protein
VGKKLSVNFYNVFLFFAVQAEIKVGGRQRDGLPLSDLKVTTASWVTLNTETKEASRDINRRFGYTSKHKKVIFENKSQGKSDSYLIPKEKRTSL